MAETRPNIEYEIRSLSAKIFQGTAILSDYERALQLMSDLGVPKEQIMEPITQQGYLSIKAYVEARSSQAKGSPNRRRLELAAAAMSGRIDGNLLYIISLYQDELRKNSQCLP